MENKPERNEIQKTKSETDREGERKEFRKL
jgi:hypothetical protein